MADRRTAEEKLTRLRELILNARAMPMSASCVINRGEVLGAIDDVIDNLPDEIAEAQSVIDASQAKIAEGEAEAGRIVAEAREHATGLAQHSEIIRVAEEAADAIKTEAGRILAEAREHAASLAQHSEIIRVAEEAAAKLKAEALEEATALRRETDTFIDSRMASFESVLHKTASQVKTARVRLAERSGLDLAQSGPRPTIEAPRTGSARGGSADAGFGGRGGDPVM